MANNTFCAYLQKHDSVVKLKHQHQDCWQWRT